MKYVNANLQSYKEFIQRMLNGEVFYHTIDPEILYLCSEDGFYLYKHGNKSIFDPFKVGYRNVCIKIEESIEEAISAKPRLCWVWDYSERLCSGRTLIIVQKRNEKGKFVDAYGFLWDEAQLATLEEIKQYLGDDNE